MVKKTNAVKRERKGEKDFCFKGGTKKSQKIGRQKESQIIKIEKGKSVRERHRRQRFRE